MLTGLVARTMATVCNGAVAATGTGLPPDQVVRRAPTNAEASWRDCSRVMQAALEQGPLVPAIGALWRLTVEGYAVAMRRGLYPEAAAAGRLPDEDLHVAEALCWMTERSYYWSYMSRRRRAPRRWDPDLRHDLGQRAAGGRIGTYGTKVTCTPTRWPATTWRHDTARANRKNASNMGY